MKIFDDIPIFYRIPTWLDITWRVLFVIACPTLILLAILIGIEELLNKLM